jgi:hypothetical protein
MEIEIHSLMCCDIASGGNLISLGFVDTKGHPHAIRLSLNQVGALAMMVPGLIDKAPRPVLATTLCAMPIRFIPGCSNNPLRRRAW